MGVAWTAAGGARCEELQRHRRKFGLGATATSLRKRIHSTMPSPTWNIGSRVEEGFALIASNPALRDSDDVLQISHGNTLLSLMHRFAPEGYDLSERPANGSVTTLDFDTSRPIAEAVTVVSYNQ